MKVGDRVRIDCPYSIRNGREATIIDVRSVSEWGPLHANAGVNDSTCYYLHVDGHGTKTETGDPIGYPRHQLRPIQPLGSWDELSQIIGKDIRNPIEVTA